MFHKEFFIKSSNAIRGSDRKKWTSLIEKNFPSISRDEVNVMLPSKGGDVVMVTKLKTHNNLLVSVVSSQKTPLFFEVDGAIYPTVYTLWTYPHIVPMFTTTPEVFRRLKGGADLMLPGVVMPSNCTLKPPAFLNVERNVPCAVNVDNIYIVAVGKTAVSGKQMLDWAMRGKGVIVLHTYEDRLWAIGDKSNAPRLDDLLLQNDNVELDQPQNMEKPVNVIRPVQNLNASECSRLVESVILNEAVDTSAAASTEEKCSFDSMDDLLYYCFLKALKTMDRKVNLPLLTGKLYAECLLPCVPYGCTLNIKKTSYKKLSSFLQRMQKKQFLQIKELSKGVESIMFINFEHIEVKEFAIDKNDIVDVERKKPEMVENKKHSGAPAVIIEELYLVSAAVLPLFKLLGYSKGSPLTASEVRNAMTSYVRKNNLQLNNLVTLDPILTDVLLCKNEFSTVSSLKWEALHSRCMAKMNSGYRVKLADREPILQKGSLKPIQLTVELRAANKKVTLINNLEMFGIDAHELAHTVQIGVATSTSVCSPPNRKDGLQVLVQGNQIAFIGKILLEEYRIPRKYIRGLELAPKNRSR